MTETHVRRATPNDIPAASEFAGKLARMHHETDPDRFLLPDNVVEGYAWWFERVLKEPKALLLVADGERSLAGYAYGGLEDRAWNLLLDEHGAIHDVYVTDAQRRLGVGRALVTGIIAALEELGAERIVLSTMPSNLAAQSLFAQFGFRATFLEMTRNRRPGG